MMGAGALGYSGAIAEKSTQYCALIEFLWNDLHGSLCIIAIIWNVALPAIINITFFHNES